MMEHIIYKTTNSLNSRFYIGMHSTTNIDDGYLGSGRRIKAEIKKYGKENFVREILEHLPTREALCEREAELVCEELMRDPLCLNLKNGGEGGSHGKESEMWKRPGFKERITKLQSIGNKKRWEDITYRESVTKSNKLTWSSAELKARTASIRANAFKNKTHTVETKAKIGAKNAEHQTGEGNSQFGTCWVTKGVKPVKIKKEQLDEYLAKGFIRGRKNR